MGEPQYTFHSTIDLTPDGKTHVKAELTRTGVPDSWKDVVSMYAHTGDKTVHLGYISATHPTEQLDFALAGKIDRITINDYEDLLAEVKQ